MSALQIVGSATYSEAVMPSHSRLSRRAALRARALGEPHQVAREALACASPHSSVIPHPDRAQEALEHGIFGGLRRLHSDWIDAPNERFVIARTDARPDRLTLILEPGSSSEDLAGLLPWWEEGDTSVASGVPGLRFRPIDRGEGIEMYHARDGGSVRFRNCGSERLLDLCTAASAQGIVMPSGALEAQERQSQLRPVSPLPSLLVRRLGILRDLDAPSITVWWNIPDRRLSVEAYRSRAPESALDRVVAALQSRELSPRLTRVDEFDHTRYHTYFRVEGSDVELDLRVQR